MNLTRHTIATAVDTDPDDLDAFAEEVADAVTDVLEAVRVNLTERFPGLTVTVED